MSNEDVQNVPGGDALSGASPETKSGEQSGAAEPLPATTAPPVALTEDKVRQMIDEATAQKVALIKEQGRRELQSQQDRNKALQRRLSSAEQRLKETDPDALDTLELGEYRATKAERERIEEEEARSRQNEEAFTDFQTQTKELFSDMGIDPNHKDIDWGKDAANFSEAYKRVRASVKKIKGGTDKSLQAKRDAELEAKITAKVRRELGLDSVDASNGGGITGDTTWLSQWGSGELPSTKENIAKAQKLLNS